MNAFDVVVAAAAVVAIVLGFSTGLLRSLATILGYLVAAPLAAVLTVPDAAQCLLPWISPIIAGYAGHDPPIPIRFCSFLI